MVEGNERDFGERGETYGHKKESNVGIWHTTGGHQDVSASVGTKEAKGIRNTCLCYRATQIHARSGAGSIRSGAGLWPFYHEG